MALENDLLGLVPVAILHGALQSGVVVAVEILEDAVLVLETTIVAHGSIRHGRERAGLLWLLSRDNIAGG